MCALPIFSFKQTIRLASHDHPQTLDFQPTLDTSIGDQRIPGLLCGDLVFNTISYRPQTS